MLNMEVISGQMSS